MWLQKKSHIHSDSDSPSGYFLDDDHTVIVILTYVELIISINQRCDPQHHKERMTTIYTTYIFWPAISWIQKTLAQADKLLLKKKSGRNVTSGWGWKWAGRWSLRRLTDSDESFKQVMWVWDGYKGWERSQRCKKKNVTWSIKICIKLLITGLFCN